MQILSIFGSPNKEPAPSSAASAFRADSLREMAETNPASSIDHTEDEQAKDGRDHDRNLQPEEPAQLVEPEGGDAQVTQPEEEDGQQGSAVDALRNGNRVGNARVAAAEDCAQHAGDESGAGVELHAEPDDGEAGSCEHCGVI